MNIAEAKEEIKNTIKAYLMKDEDGEYVIDSVRQRPVLLMGPPGVGKTRIMEQIARECRVGLVAYTITHHTRQSAIGLPFIEKKSYGGKEMSVTEYTMSEIVASVYDSMEETGLGEGILFIDEINCVSETLAPAMLQFLQAKTFGTHKIPEGWIIIAAGNPPEYNKSVREFDIVTLDRIRRIDITPDFNAWKNYAVSAAVHPAVMTYLGIKPQNFSRMETTVDGMFFVTPRGWDDLSKLITAYEKLGLDVSRETVGEYLQFVEVAKDFANYYELYKKYNAEYRVEEILDGRINEGLCERFAKAPFDEKYSVTGLIISSLGNEAKALSGKAEMLTELKKALTGVRSRFEAGKEAERREESSGYIIADILGKCASELSESLKADTRAKLVTSADRKRRLFIIDFVEKAAISASESGTEDFEKLWERLGKEYGVLADGYEDDFDELGLRLEHAFDFMEAAFGAGSEMVIFLNALNTNPCLVDFLKDYNCERYFEYNKELLFEERENHINEELETL